MNKVVKEHVPVERLPEELRGGFAAGEIVEVEIRRLTASEVAAAAPAERISLRALLSMGDDGAGTQRPSSGENDRNRAFLQEIWDSVGPRRTTTAEAVRRIRELRDEGEE